MDKKNFAANFKQVDADMAQKWPNVKFYSTLMPGILCVMSVRNILAWEIGELLKVYSDFLPEIRILVQAWRHWLKVILGSLNEKVT